MVKFKFVFTTLFIHLFFACFFCSHAFSATLIINDDNQLMGANEVLVNGTLYDVRFVDGSAGNLFSDGNDWYTTTFTTKEDAIEASQALLDQVFLGIYDTDPELTNGIEDLSDTYINTAYDIRKGKRKDMVLIVTTHNYSDDKEDTVYYPAKFDQVTVLTLDSTNDGKTAWATWALSPNAVPVPGSLSLLGLGITAMAAINRKRRI